MSQQSTTAKQPMNDPVEEVESESPPPRVAVLTPVYNDAGGLEKSFKSLVSQGVSFDWVVVDDGSSPPAKKPSALADFRIIWIRLEKNQGITAALNAGLNYILNNGYTWVARLDAGDEMLPFRLKKQCETLSANPHLGAIGSAVELVTPEGRQIMIRRMPTTSTAIAKRHKSGTGLVHPAVMITTDILRKVGLYQDLYPAAEDFDMWLRIHKVAELANLSDVLLRMEVRPGSLSTGRRKTQVNSRIRLLAREFDWLSPRCYAGLINNYLLSMLSHSQSLRIKSTIASLRERITRRSDAT